MIIRYEIDHSPSLYNVSFYESICLSKISSTLFSNGLLRVNRGDEGSSFGQIDDILYTPYAVMFLKF
jgi:hypothetical protein